jgi:hypothetical protein
MYLNLTRKDHEGRKATIYETRNEVMAKLQESLDKGLRCLAISDSKEHVKTAEKYLSCEKSFFFNADEDGEEGEGVGIEDFRRDPKSFIKLHRPKLLFCSPVLRSGVSFEGLFDEVFIFVQTENFTPRDIIQFLSREREWKRAYICTNRIKLPVPRAEKEDKYTRVQVMLDKDRREQLLARPISTAQRLAERGCEVEFIASDKHVLPIALNEIPKYAKRGKTGRSKFESYVFSILLGQKSAPVTNLIKRRDAFVKFEGGSEALEGLFATGDYIAFYEFCQTHYKLAAPKWFKKFDEYMRGLGVNSNGFYAELAEDSVSRTDLKRSHTLKSKVLKDIKLPTEESYKLAVESKSKLKLMLTELDQLETSDRDDIELIMEKL